MKKRLPLAFSSLEKIVETGCVYVDKTKFAYQLFYEKRYDYVFLSRPRRFGKTLFVDTLKQLFLGNREIFKETWIYDSDYDWQKYPIIHIDFSNFDKKNIGNLEDNIIASLELIAEKYNVTNLSRFVGISMKFSELIREFSKINKVVILIDEYDKPVLDNINDLTKAESVRDLLKAFYEVIKGNDEYIRAVFLTGITKFNQMSIFSGLNNIYDISLDNEYATILGYTQKELELYFNYNLNQTSSTLGLTLNELLEKMKTWYNGYRFSKSQDTVYNPFSVLNFFEKNDFRNYWFDTGTPTFLIHLLKSQYQKLKDIESRSYAMDFIGGFELKSLSLIPVMYQTGYLTIVGYSESGLKLDYPNLEIRQSLKKAIDQVVSENYYESLYINTSNLVNVEFEHAKIK